MCTKCCLRLPVAKSLCYRCQQPTLFYRTCPSCLGVTALKTVWGVTSHTGLGKTLIWRLKFTGARSAAAVIAHTMAKTYKAPSNTYIVPVPTATSRARQRGYDQAVLLAKCYANICGATFLPCLARAGQQHQRGSSRTTRLMQQRDVYRVKRGYIITASNVLLIDDVITTGATLQSAAAVLKLAGAANIQAIAFAQA